MSKDKRRGFTLVELLIVIVVIGILSAMMMLSSTEAVSSAKASNIVSNLRNLKTATLSWYADHLDSIDTSTNGVSNGIIKVGTANKTIQGAGIADSIKKYLNNDNIPFDSKTDKHETKGTYGVWDAGANNRDTWYVGYRFNDREDDVRTKLKARAKTTGLIFATDTPNTRSGENVVWMKVLGDWNP